MSTAAGLGGARWLGLARLVVESSTFLSSLVLARLLTPADFGPVAVASIVYALAIVCAINVAGAPLIVAAEVRDATLGVAVSLSLVAGALLTGLTLAASAALEPTLGAEVSNLVALAAPSFLLCGAGAVPGALLQRRLDFRRIALIDVAAALPGIAVAIALAAIGVGGAAIIAGLLVTAGLTSVLNWLAAPVSTLRWRTAVAADLLRFGLPASASASILVFSRTIDYAVLAARTSAAQLGLYWRAYQLAVEYQGKVSHILVRVAFPMFARAAEAGTLPQLRARIVRVHAVVLLPLLGLLAAGAPAAVPLLYGPGWEGAITPTRILCIAGACAVISAGTDPLLQAIGRPVPLAVFNAATLPVVGLAAYVTAPHGIVAVCWAVSAARVVLVVIQQYALVARVAGIAVSDIFRFDVVPALIASCALCAAAWPVVEVMLSAGMPAALALAIAAAVGALVYALVLRVAFPDSWRDAVSLVRRARRGRPAVAP
jgi:PST family polysaccharide transporter